MIGVLNEGKKPKRKCYLCHTDNGKPTDEVGQKNLRLSCLTPRPRLDLIGASFFMEQFKSVEGFPFYEVSNRGRVLSIKRRRTKGGILKPQPDERGYLHVIFVTSERRHTINVHRLVASAFIPNPGNLPCVNHIDGDKSNNYAENLEWCTHAENNRHAVRTGLNIAKGLEQHGMAKLKNADVLQIREMLARGLTTTEVSKMFPVSRTTISQIKSGYRWAKL